MSEADEGERGRINQALVFYGNQPGEPMYEYFSDKLPEGLMAEEYAKGRSCMTYAKLILNEIGGPNKARVYYVGDPKTKGHTLVVPNEFSDDRLALNNLRVDDKWGRLRVGKVKEIGEDITEEIVREDWERL
jgi:hypothetical protein